MPLLATIINTAAILAGGGIGLLLKGKIPKKITENILRVLGLCVVAFGIKSGIGGDALLLISCVALGTVIGMLCRIETGLNKFGAFIQKKINLRKENKNKAAVNTKPSVDATAEALPVLEAGEIALIPKKPDETANTEDNRFYKGFITATLLFCVGAMSILGPLNAGLKSDYTMIVTKSILDGISALALSSVYGAGVLLSAPIVFVYQGIWDLSALGLNGLIPEVLTAQKSPQADIIHCGDN